MVIILVQTSRKTKNEMALPSRMGFKEDESEKLEREA
jgi:hypothetical protein